MGKRLNIKTILADPKQRRELMVETIIATQAREGITTTREQAEAAYDAVQVAKARKPTVGLLGPKPKPRRKYDRAKEKREARKEME